MLPGIDDFEVGRCIRREMTTPIRMLTEDHTSGTVIEFDETNVIVTRPKNKRTEEHATGRFG